MARRIRLRSRVFLLTALYALVLILIAFALSWRARVYEREVHRLMFVESTAVEALNELIRNQSSWNQRWQTTPDLSAEEAMALAGRYGSVEQLLESRLLGQVDTTRLRDRTGRLRRDVTQWSRTWNELTPEQRHLVSVEIDQRSGKITRLATLSMEDRRQEIDRTLSHLATDARGTMWTALGVVWMIGVLAFAVARGTLTKVVRPIEELSRAAQRLEAGQLDSRAPIGGDHEIAQLGRSFNRMADALMRSHEELRDRARTDELTGLPNFRAFREAIEDEIERADRFEKSFGVLILDLDHFKSYNDTWGHLAGNEALELAAETIRQTVRAVDIPARYGGEEFAVIVPASDAEGLASLAERIRIAIAQLPPIEDRRTLTVSVGGALYPSDGVTPEELFATADQRLYEAKERGRNRSVTANDRVARGASA